MQKPFKYAISIGKVLKCFGNIDKICRQKHLSVECVEMYQQNTQNVPAKIS